MAAKFEMNCTMFCVSENGTVLAGRRLVFPCTRRVNPFSVKCAHGRSSRCDFEMTLGHADEPQG